MKQEIKEQWIKALRSGKYKQGRTRLRTENGEPQFCCLGVLCDIIDPHGWDEAVATSNNNNLKFRMHMGQFAYPSFDIDNIVQAGPGIFRKLALLNDEGHDFESIADYIEKNV